MNHIVILSYDEKYEKISKEIWTQIWFKCVAKYLFVKKYHIFSDKHKNIIKKRSRHRVNHFLLIKLPNIFKNIYQTVN